MITQPSTKRILEVIQRELAENVRPTVTDPHALASIQMVEHILGTLAIRAGHEIAWMVDEIDGLARLGEQVLSAQPDATRVAAALDSLRAAPAASLHYDDVASRYSLASEILSCALEDVPADVPLRATVEALLDARLAHEVDIMGEFQLVGRS
jgi:hypothetical protein